MITSQPHELTWGSFILASELPPDLPWLCETMAADASLGEAVPVVETIESQLVDGSLSVITSYGNREVSWEIGISADDGRGLAQAEAALMAEVTAEHPAPLKWTPPALDAWTCVFDVVTARLSPKYDADWDLEEKRRVTRYYTLTFECLPWARDDTMTDVAALPIPTNPDAPATVVSIDTCDSTTGWVRSTEPASGGWSSLTGPTVASSSVRVTGVTGASWESGLALERTGASVPMTATPYLRITAFLTFESAANPRPNVSVTYGGGGQRFYPVAMRQVPGADPHIFDVYFKAPSSFTKMKVTTRFTEANVFKALFIYDVSRTDQISTGATGFEVARTAKIGGSAPTQAAITVSAADSSSTLMDRTGFVYTGSSAGISLRPLIISSATPETIDANLVSGKSTTLASASTFLVPVTMLAEANYSLIARLKHSGSITVSWSANVVDSAGNAIPGSEIVESGSMLVTNPGAAGWMLHELGDIPMPVVSIEGSTTHCVKVTISMASGGSSVDLDNAWLLDTENGAVTMFQNTVSYALNAVELRSPQLDAPRQSVIGTWVTYGAQDVTTRLVKRLGTHLLRPGTAFVLTMMDKQKFAPTSFKFYKRYGTYPGPEISDGEAA